MREYETTFIVQPEISDEGSQSILTKLDGILDAGGADRLMCEDHGKRKLAYEIDKFHKGHYRILRYLDDGQVVKPLERIMRLDESVLRFLTIVVSEDVVDIEARKSQAAEDEQEQNKRAAERAEREAEEAKQRAEAEEARAREEAERAEAEAAASEAAVGEAAAEDADAPAAESADAAPAAESADASAEAEADKPQDEKSGDEEADTEDTEKEGA